jgi:hypothetical protein
MYMQLLSRCLALLVSVLFSDFAVAQVPVHQRIDQLIGGKADYARQAAAIASDEEFLRRIYLDLNGMIPSASEVRTFLADTDTDKRLKVINQLLAGDAFIRHMTTTLDVLLMDRRPEKHVKRAEWLEYLRSAVAANKPYDRLVAEMLSADGTDPKKRPAARFFLDREGDPNVITKDLSRIFLGMNLTCCQCHDHPLIDGYKQQYYYGLLAFLNRSFLYTGKGSNVAVLAEKGEGDVTFQSVFKAKLTRNTGPRLLDGEDLPEPRFEKGKEYVLAFKPGEKPQPKFSRRSLLAKELTSHPRFARTAANRVWSLLLGRGIIHPVDLDHDGNPPSHPELLDMLAGDLAEHAFDVKGLIKDIASSQTYQRSSALPKGAKEADPATFAVYPLRPLTPEQLAWSMMQATGLIDAEAKAQTKPDHKALLTKLAGNVQTFVALFGNQPGEPFDPGQFEATLDQTLFLDNGALLRGWLTPRPGNLIDRLGKLAGVDAIADELYLSVLSRLPAPEERQEMSDFLARHQAERTAALQDLAWALLASAEFRFNH